MSEAGCPFCRDALSEAFRASPRPLAPAARLTRAALFAFGTGTLALAAACSSSSLEPPYGAPPNGSGAGEDGGANVSEASTEAGIVDATVDADTDGPGAMPVYGAPAQPEDASEDHTSVVALYGIPPHS